MAGKALKKSRPKERRGPGGRPAAAQAGEVDERLLDAATTLFLERGFEGTSFDQVAALAGAGKASLYARYTGKSDLFASVIRWNVEQNLRSSHPIDPALDLAARLRIAGLGILRGSLQPKPLAMMRVMLATAHRFPEVAQIADRIGWEGGVQKVVDVIAARDPGAKDRARPAAAWFISLTFAPQQMRALLGDTPEQLEACAPGRVDDAIDMLSKSGWLNGWS